MNNVRFHFAGAQVCDIQATADVCQSHSSPSSLRWSGGGAGGKWGHLSLMILTFSLKNSELQSNKQPTWHTGRYWRRRKTAVLVTLEASHAGDFLLPPSCPTLFRTELAFSLLEFCLVFAAVVTLWHALERPAVPNRKKKEGCPPYLCSQQGIMLLFSLQDLNLVLQARGSQDGPPLQGAGICPLPTVCVCVCVCVSFVHACTSHLFCCGKPQITERGGFLPIARWQ